MNRARAIVRLVRAEQWQQAFDIAKRAYRSCGLFVMEPWADINLDGGGDRIAAALLIPLGRKQTRSGFRRFQTKTKTR